MLGGIKAALGAGGSRRGHVLPLSGTRAAQMSPGGTPESSARGRRAEFDEESPPQQRSTPRKQGAAPKWPCDLPGPYVDVEAPPTASTACPSSTAGSGFWPSSTSTGRGFRAAAPTQEVRLGGTQVVISLDLDIMGPMGLLAQLGLPAEHELERGALRVQCCGMEVQHRRRADSAATAESRRFGHDEVGLSTAKVDESAQHFFIGEEEAEDEEDEPLEVTIAAAEQVLDVISAAAPAGEASAPRSRGQQVAWRQPPAASGRAPRTAGSAVAGRGGRGGQRRAFGERATDDSPKSPPSSAVRRSVASARRIASPSPSADLTEDEMRELETLRLKNRRLECDLFESMKELEAVDLTSSSSCSSSPAASPREGTGIFRRTASSREERCLHDLRALAGGADGPTTSTFSTAADAGASSARARRDRDALPKRHEADDVADGGRGGRQPSSGAIMSSKRSASASSRSPSSRSTSESPLSSAVCAGGLAALQGPSAGEPARGRTAPAFQRGAAGVARDAAADGHTMLPNSVSDEPLPSRPPAS